MNTPHPDLLGAVLVTVVAIGVPVLVELLKVVPFAAAAVLLAYLDRRRIVGRFRPWLVAKGLRLFLVVYAIAAAYWLLLRQPWK